jgi:hypothetical protein
LLEHDLFGKPVSTFPDHALGDAETRLPAAQTEPMIDIVTHEA